MHPADARMARLYRINDQITAMLDQDGVTDLTDEKRDDLLDTLTHFVADSFDDARAGRDVPPVIRPDYSATIATVTQILTDNGPKGFTARIETWDLPGAGFRVAEVGWQSDDKKAGAAFMQSHLPHGLAVCAQVERCVISAQISGDEFDLEVERLLDLIREPRAAEQNIASFTKGDADKVAGFPLSDSQYRRVVKAAPFSLGEPFAELVRSITDES